MLVVKITNKRTRSATRATKLNLEIKWGWEDFHQLQSQLAPWLVGRCFASPTNRLNVNNH